MAELWHELLEPVDRAASAHPRVDGVAAGAKPLVLRLEIETLVEVERRAILVELGADPAVVADDEVDLARPGQHRALDRGRRNAFGPLALLPDELREKRVRLHRDSQDHFVLDHEPGHGL